MTGSSLTCRRHFRGRSGLLTAFLLSFAALALAASAYAEPAQAPQTPSHRPSADVKQPCRSLADRDRRDHDDSGTRGRMGLGADPAHPEGPGNAPN